MYKNNYKNKSSINHVKHVDIFVAKSNTYDKSLNEKEKYDQN